MVTNMTVSSQTIGIGPNKVVSDFVKSGGTHHWKKLEVFCRNMGEIGLSLLIVALIYSAKVEKMFN